MWIEAKRRSGRNENLFVFQFTSLELDYEPYIQHLTDIVPVLGNERAEDRLIQLIQLIHRLQARCDDTYTNGEVVASSFLFADEMAEMTTHMSYLLLYLDEKSEEMEGETRDE
ncbi:hypothetical protein [Fusicatenibacter sp.]